MDVSTSDPEIGENLNAHIGSRIVPKCTFFDDMRHASLLHILLSALQGVHTDSSFDPIALLLSLSSRSLPQFLFATSTVVSTHNQFNAKSVRQLWSAHITEMVEEQITFKSAAHNIVQMISASVSLSFISRVKDKAQQSSLRGCRVHPGRTIFIKYTLEVMQYLVDLLSVNVERRPRRNELC